MDLSVIRDGRSNSETRSSIATKRGVAFSDVFNSKAYRRNAKLEKLRKWGDFYKKCGDNTVDRHVRTKVPAGRKKGDEQILYGRLVFGLTADSANISSTWFGRTGDRDMRFLLPL